MTLDSLWSIIIDMRYPWIFLSIASLWIALGLVMYQAPDRIDATSMYLFGVAFSTVIALLGFRSEA